MYSCNCWQASVLCWLLVRNFSSVPRASFLGAAHNITVGFTQTRTSKLRPEREKEKGRESQNESWCYFYNLNWKVTSLFHMVMVTQTNPDTTWERLPKGVHARDRTHWRPPWRLAITPALSLEWTHLQTVSRLSCREVFICLGTDGDGFHVTGESDSLPAVDDPKDAPKGCSLSLLPTGGSVS